MRWLLVWGLYCTGITVFIFQFNHNVFLLHSAEGVINVDNNKASRTLFVGDFNKSVTEDELRSVFRKYGHILVCVLYDTCIL